LGRCSGLHGPRTRSDLRHRRHTPIARRGHSGQAHRTGLTLAERLCRTADRIDPARVFGPHHCLGRGTSAPGSEILRSLLQRRPNASVSKQGCAGLSAGSAIRCHKFTRPFGRTSSPLRSGLSFRYTQAKHHCATRRRPLISQQACWPRKLFQIGSATASLGAASVASILPPARSRSAVLVILPRAISAMRPGCESLAMCRMI
jgi:hypothetical protein